MSLKTSDIGNDTLQTWTTDLGIVDGLVARVVQVPSVGIMTLAKQPKQIVFPQQPTGMHSVLTDSAHDAIYGKPNLKCDKKDFSAK